MLTSTEVDAPVAVGVRRPTILLPASLVRACPRTDLGVVLAHEMMHHRDRDLLVETFLAVMGVVWWFHPVAFALQRELRRLREARCDASVLAAGLATPEEYCRVLLHVAAASLPSPAVAMREVSHPLAARFKDILQPAPLQWWRAPLASLVCAACAALMLPNSTWARENRRHGGPDATQSIEIVHIFIEIFGKRVTSFSSASAAPACRCRVSPVPPPDRFPTISS